MHRSFCAARRPLDSDAMDTANAHNDMIDETSDPLEFETTTEASAEKPHPEAPFPHTIRDGRIA